MIKSFLTWFAFGMVLAFPLEAMLLSRNPELEIDINAFNDPLRPKKLTIQLDNDDKPGEEADKKTDLMLDYIKQYLMKLPDRSSIDFKIEFTDIMTDQHIELVKGILKKMYADDLIKDSCLQALKKKNKHNDIRFIPHKNAPGGVKSDIQTALWLYEAEKKQ